MRLSGLLTALWATSSVQRACDAVDASEVAFFVLSTTSPTATCPFNRTQCEARPLEDTFVHYNARAVGSMRTWMRAFPHSFVIMPDNARSHAFIARRGCERTVRRPAAAAAAGGADEANDEDRDVAIVEANCDGRPILLTSHPRFNCSDHYRGDGPCCKANFAFWYLLEVHYITLHTRESRSKRE